MTFTIPNLSAASHEDQAFPNSTDLEVLAGGFTGDGIVSGCAVTAQGTPDMTVHVAAGAAYFNGVEVTVAAADPAITPSASSPRRDLVVVNDAGSAVVVAGTPQAPNLSDPSVVPVLPALPADSIALAAVDVPANATVITSAEIVDKRIGSVGSYAASLATSQDLSYYRQVGTSPLERYYIAGFSSVMTAAVYAGSSATLYAVPFVTGRGGTVDRIAIWTSSSGAGNVRLGAYASTSATNLYPDELMFDAGTLAATSSGLQAITISEVLPANSLVWFAFNTSASLTIYYGQSSGCPTLGVLGLPSTGNWGSSGAALQIAESYGALPDPFPSSATVSTSAPFVGVRYSA